TVKIARCQDSIIQYKSLLSRRLLFFAIQEACEQKILGIAQSQHELCDRHILALSSPLHRKTTIFEIIN
ncbi:MAG: hypothetical protein C6Y22_25815, partial [Hapalosiphonaceae cyanobacterium JJU2]